MKTAQTVISGFTVQFEADEESTQCFIFDSKASASLECLLGTGCLMDSDGNGVRVSQAFIDKVAGWAYKQGY